MRRNKYIASLTIQSQIVDDDAIDQGMGTNLKISFPFFIIFTTACLLAS
jgi:hypothetical protein